MNVSPPWSRRVCTRPASVTSLPASEARASPQVWVRSTLVPIVLEKGRLARCARLVFVGIGGALEERRRDVLGHVSTDLSDDGREAGDALRLRDQIANDHVSAPRFGRPPDDRNLGAVLYRALELLVERAVGVVDRDGEPSL